MKKNTIRRASWRTKSVLVLLAVALTPCLANAALINFDDGFPGPGLDAAWTQAGDPNGHPAAIAGTYDISDVVGGPGVKLQRFFAAGSTHNTHTHEIEVVLNPFLLSGSGGTQTDLKWKSFGANGFMEIVLNSFGDMRLFHNDGVSGSNIQPNTNIGYTDGDLLKITSDYDLGTDTLSVTYSLNGGPAQAFYAGNGVNGTVGDLITNFIEVEVFKWGSGSPEAAISIDRWRLASVPEPASAALLAFGSLCLVVRSRRGATI